MIAPVENVFADTGFWIALVTRNDQHHQRALRCMSELRGRIVTTKAVLLETANALARVDWRPHAVKLMSRIETHATVRVVELTADLWDRGWDLYRNRMDKGWSLTDCISFLVMQDSGLTSALTPDEHFRQAGFRALMLEEP